MTPKTLTVLRWPLPPEHEWILVAPGDEPAVLLVSDDFADEVVATLDEVAA